MSYQRLGADEPETATVVLARLDAQTRELLERAKAEDKLRKITLYLTGAGVLFAAVKLGFIAIPQFLKRRSKLEKDLESGRG